MNIVNRLTLRHLRLNKKRTLVTIIGVIISAAMITAVATFSVSFLDLFQRSTISQTGDWQVQYSSVPAENISIITQDQNTRQAAIQKGIGYSELPESKNDGKPYLFLQELSQDSYEMFPFMLTEGRFPQSADEVIAPEHLISNGGIPVHVGDTLTLNLGDRSVSYEGETYTLTQENSYDSDETFVLTGQTRTVTVTGIIERPNIEPYQAPGYTLYSLLDPSTLSSTDRVDVTTSLKDISRELYGRSEQIAEAADTPSDLDVVSVNYNSALLRYYGVTSNNLLNNTIYSFALIIILIIMVGSVALIYNAFAISISERSRHLGMLASVGATRGQKRRSVFFEGFVIGIISIPLGIGFGILGMWVTFQCISPLIANVLANAAALRLIVSPFSVVVSAVFSALTIFISSWIPARRASRITPIDAIRQSRDVKLKGRAVKTSRLTRKVFGFEAELALKNLKRNKKRYRSTIFSLIISIVLFLATSFYLNFSQAALGMDMEASDYDLAVTSYSEQEGDAVSFYQQVRGLPLADEVTAVN
ncbi:MAG: FtsX-like permease family protein, partial [Clostridiales bacterium]|nr:FtsX-like permease family protein [Clostridiales bacterium]